MKTASDIKRILPLAVLAVAGILFLASLARAAQARGKIADLGRREAENLRLAAEIGPEHAALAEYKAFVASLPLAELRRISIAAFIPKELTPRYMEENTVPAESYGLYKTSATLKWSSISGDDLARAVESAGASQPPFRLESVALSKAAGAGGNLAAEAVFIAYTK
jgi:hypothetical protein